MRFVVESVLIGQAIPIARGESSAIAKTPADGSRRVSMLGIEGDTQADLSVHGGPDKAIHHYPRDHYNWWRDALGPLPILDAPGAFGENISTTGLTEWEACIGDRFRLGAALVEIAQGRQPCWKQAHRLGNASVVAAMVRSGRCGWYYRVVEGGVVAAGDALELTARPHPAWTVARVIAMLIHRKGEHDEMALRDLAALEVLASGWRARALSLAR